MLPRQAAKACTGAGRSVSGSSHGLPVRARLVTRACQARMCCHYDQVRRTVIFATAASVVLGASAGVGLGSSPTLSAASPAKRVPAIKPPVITESFTLLPCDKGSTIGQEGCEEHSLVAADKRIDREVSLLFKVLHDDAARRRLIRAETAWFAYRQADSASQADIYEGGSESDVVAVECAVNDDKTRSTDLLGFFRGLEQGIAHVPVFP